MLRSNVRKSGYAFEYRITFLGDKKTGKTSLINKYINNTFSHRYRPTVEEHITHIVEHKGNICVCLFIDTSGGHDFPAMRRLAISKGNAFFVLYSINDRRSLETARHILLEIKSLKDTGEDTKIILLGTKTDLELERVIQPSEGENLLDIVHDGHICSQFFEVGAKSNDNVQSVFNSLLDMFIPTNIESEPDILPGHIMRSSRRKSKKKYERRKPKTTPLVEQKPTHTPSFSDSELNEHPVPLEQFKINDCMKSNSLSLLPTNEGRVKKESMSSPKSFLRKTFGSMQKLLSSTNSNENICRSNSVDSSLRSSKRRSRDLIGT